VEVGCLARILGTGVWNCRFSKTENDGKTRWITEKMLWRCKKIGHIAQRFSDVGVPLRPRDFTSTPFNMWK
jgi:hypothetical protein